MSFWLLLAFPGELAPSLASVFLDTILTDSCSFLSFSTEKVKKVRKKGNTAENSRKIVSQFFFFNAKNRRERGGLKSWHEEKEAFAVIYGRSCCPTQRHEFPEARATGDTQGSWEQPVQEGS